MNSLNAVRSAVHVAVAVIGTILSYRVNRNGDNSDFIGRMICLSWPIGVKVHVAFFAIHLVARLSDRIAWTEISPHLERIFDLLISICFYWLLYKHMSLVAKPRGADNPDALGFCIGMIIL